MRVFRELTHPWVNAQLWVDAHPDFWFEKWDQKRLESPDQGKRPRAWIVDLDSTLFCVTPRIKSTFIDFLGERQGDPSWYREIGQRLNPSNQCYDIQKTLQRLMAGLVPDSEQAQAAEKLWGEFRGYWGQHFFSSRHLAQDVPAPGAQDFARRIVHRGDQLIYLTGRDEPRCEDGTRASLEAHGFPMGSHTRLMMKPSSRLGDLEFKRLACEELAAQYDVAFSVDNEPENLVMFAEAFPTADICFFHTVMSPRVPEADYAKVLAGRPAWRLWDFLGTKNP
jgi:hypothetical protein